MCDFQCFRLNEIRFFDYYYYSMFKEEETKQQKQNRHDFGHSSSGFELNGTPTIA